MAERSLFVFVDESGDFNFSPSGSKYYTFTAIITHYPSEKATEFQDLKNGILSKALIPKLSEYYLEEFIAHRFHASEDLQDVRDEVFKLIGSMERFKAHSIVVPKNKTNPSIREPHKFYPKALSSLLDYIFKRYKYSDLVIFVDGMAVNYKKKAFLKAIKKSIALKAPRKPYSIYCPSSSSNYFLQVVDYINWAIYKKWESGDLRSYDTISKFLGTPEKNIYERGDTEYYSVEKK